MVVPEDPLRLDELGDGEPDCGRARAEGGGDLVE